MLLNKVVVGRDYKMTVDNTALTGPPASYDPVNVYSLTFVRRGAGEGDRF